MAETAEKIKTDSTTAAYPNHRRFFFAATFFFAGLAFLALAGDFGFAFALAFALAFFGLAAGLAALDLTFGLDLGADFGLAFAFEITFLATGFDMMGAAICGAAAISIIAAPSQAGQS